jgi:general secretion pathway protein K
MHPAPCPTRSRFRHPGKPPSPDQRGIALIMVLWLTVLLTVIASGFAYSMRGEALAARNTMSLAQARAAADGAVERTLFEVVRSRGLADAWTANGMPHSWKDGEIEIAATIVDENARIDLNTAPEPLLKGLLQSAGGLDPDAAQRLLDVILDWRDADDQRRPNGAEAADYRAAGSKYLPSNVRFESVGDLGRVLGMTPALMAKLADSVTVYSRQRGINPATASRDVLLALPGITAEQVDAFITARDEALANRLPIPPLAAAAGFAVAPGAILRITAQARLPDGVTFVRDAVLYPPGNPQQPVVVLLWQEGIPRAGAEPAPADPHAVQK